MSSGTVHNYSGHFDWIFSDQNTDLKFEDFVSQNPMKLEQLRIKIQVFASKFGLNNCREDMGTISREGCICVYFREDESFFYVGKDASGNLIKVDYINKYMSIFIINKEDRKDYSRRDFSSYGSNSHLFFEIPVIQNFTEHQFNKWLNYLARELPKKAVINLKRRQIWLRKKHMVEDFNNE